MNKSLLWFPVIAMAGTPLLAIGANQADMAGFATHGGSSLVRDSFGNCVRTGTWTDAARGCGADRAAPTSAGAKKNGDRGPVVPPPPPEPRVAETGADNAEVRALSNKSGAEVAPVTSNGLSDADRAAMDAAARKDAAAAAAADAKGNGGKVMDDGGGVVMEAETLFALSQATLKPSAVEKLDAVAAAVNGKPYRSVVVTGHADRTGSAKFNKRLSQRRAMAVKKYLVAQGLPSDRIRARGMGISQPKTRSTDCEGLVREDLAACLQPDRRVEIVVMR
ncbi:MAG: OmpA family protein [Burkholderiales bacterium]|jgi:outer membrane protein OmpA-like peptidoglycan-associated protein|nr:OmpA family protein [Burkholderiales bacterium]